MLKRFLILISVSAALMLGQKGSGSGSSTSGTSGSRPPTTTTTTPPLNPTNPNNNTNPTNDTFYNQPMFLSGKVMFEDGSPVNKDIRIERACGASVRTEANVDSRGGFSFQVGGNAVSSGIIGDASQSSGGFGSMSQGQSQPSILGDSSSGNSKRLTPEATLWGCELRAAYPGYRSDVITLAGRRALDNPDVGVIILHRIANVVGTTISITTAEAPKSAQKNYEKGILALRKENAEEAEKRLSAATEEYPKYAIAWFALGQLQDRQNRAEDARKSYLAAVAADKHYVSPYDQLALLAARDSKWEDAAQYSKEAISLNPVEFPSAYWYNAVANFNLNHDAEATKSAEALIKLDTRHRFPEVNRMMAEMALTRKDYASAAEHLKVYLVQVPGAKDADTLKQQLLKIEEARGPAKQ